jgi:uncharacterized protein YneF (UPF0154 family)
MSTAIESLRIGLVIGTVCGAFISWLITYLSMSKEPPMASRSTHFANHGRMRNWKLPPSAR